MSKLIFDREKVVGNYTWSFVSGAEERDTFVLFWPELKVIVTKDFGSYKDGVRRTISVYHLDKQDGIK